MPPSRKGPDPLLEHWRTLTLHPGAPECIIKEAHRFHIRRVHPDLGGSDRDAKRVNIANDKLRGRGSAANEYVGRHFEGESFVVLGLAATADPALVKRAGQTLAKELAQLPRLAQRVERAAANFGKVRQPAAQPPRATPAPPSPPSAKPWMPSIRRQPVVASRLDGLPPNVDFGAVAWGSEVEVVVRLTWTGRSPTNVRADVGQPFRVSLAQSSVRTGRVALKVSIEWASPRMKQALVTRLQKSARFDAGLTVEWDEGSSAQSRVTATSTVPAAGPTLRPTQPGRGMHPQEETDDVPDRQSEPTPLRSARGINVTPGELDLGSVRLRQQAKAALTIQSTIETIITLKSSAWLSASTNVWFLKANEPLELGFMVDWVPIIERGAASIKVGRPLRPTGNIVIRWTEGSITVPVRMLVKTAR